MTSDALSAWSSFEMRFRVRSGSRSVLEVDGQSDSMIHVVAQVKRRRDTCSTAQA